MRHELTLALAVWVWSVGPSHGARAARPEGNSNPRLTPQAGTPGAPPAVSDWCMVGLDVLDPETCYVLPRERTAPMRLVIYLHGIVPPTADSPQKTIVQTVVRNAATRAGWAAILPRGVRGVGPSYARDYWAWPTAATDHGRLARGLVSKLLEKRRALEALAGAPFERTYLAGSSNGAYFVAALALGGDIDVDGFGAFSGGATFGRTLASIAAVPRRPFYVGFGSLDPAREGPKGLGVLLREAGWPSTVHEHDVGHGAREIYLEEAFAFWDANR
jgi:predicted esterase